jgi:hypothetical protein
MPVEYIHPDHPSDHRDFATDLIKQVKRERLRSDGPNHVRELHLRFFQNVIDFDLLIEIACGLHCQGAPVYLYEDTDGEFYIEVDCTDKRDAVRFIKSMEREEQDLVNCCDRDEIPSRE